MASSSMKFCLIVAFIIFAKCAIIGVGYPVVNKVSPRLSFYYLLTICLLIIINNNDSNFICIPISIYGIASFGKRLP